MTSLFRKVTWWVQRRRKEDELREELQFHLQEDADARQGDGLPEDQARWAARRDLGNVTLLREDTRMLWSWTLLEQLAQDVRFALRTMCRNRVFTALVALAFALGIGANSTIYSFMESLLLRSLPVSEPESLVVLNWRSKPIQTAQSAREPGFSFVMHSANGRVHIDSATGRTGPIFPYPAFELFQRSSDVFSQVFAYYPVADLNAMIQGEAEVASGLYVSGDFFGGLRVPPAAGRLIIADDDRAGAPPVAVLRMGFAQRRLGSEDNAVGQSILINGVAFTVVGVTPADFFGVDPAQSPDIYLPLHTNLLTDAGPAGTTEQTYINPNHYWIGIMGRLRPGVSMAQAQANLAPLFQQWVTGTASNDRERANLPTLQLGEGAAGLDSLRRQYSKPLYVLLAMVGLLLALACANTASLLLAKAAARSSEMAVRLSLGASRLRIIRQLLTEGVLLASLGGALGLLFAVGGVRFLTLLLANGQENFTLRAELNWNVLGVTMLLSLVCGVLFGLAPALQAARPDVMPALKEGRAHAPHVRTRGGLVRVPLRKVLVVCQVAISLLLLMAAGLFARTLSNLQSIQLGFNSDRLLLFELDARAAGHQDPEIVAFYGDLRKRLETIPGVRNATLSHAFLIRAGRRLPITVSGAPAEAARVLNVGAAYFTTMQIPMRAGREIDERDQPGSARVAVVDELFAQTYFGNENPVGRSITVGPRALEIVGVSASARYGGLKGEIPPVVFIPYSQQTVPPVLQMTYAIRATGDPLLFTTAVRETVRQADTRIPLTNVRTASAEIDKTINQEIVFARLCTGFAFLALIIACVGLYGTMAYTVARRTGEIGIRMALGARRGAVTWMVLREVCLLAAIGLAISVPAALFTSKFIQSFLFEVKPNDPSTLIFAIAIFLGSALLASYGPARRASRIDPLIALRHE